MSEAGDRPASLVAYSLAVVGALIGGYALYSYAGQQFTQWFVNTKMPQIQAETESQFQSESPTSNFDGAALQFGSE